MTMVIGEHPSIREKSYPSRDLGQIWFAAGESRLGSILVARSRFGVCAVLLGDHPQELALDLRTRQPGAPLIGADDECYEYVQRVIEYIDSPKQGLDLPLDLRGTEFQRLVWHALRSIPAGSTISYAGLAKRLNMPNTARAVARACGANPFAIAIPCHRVVGSKGELTGYRWGIERKRDLLKKETEA